MIGVTWRIVTPNAALTWPQSPSESWMLNPPNRYIITTDQQEAVKDNLASWSDLKQGKLYRPLNARANLANTRILIERHRSRGIGDLLFVTGPIAYLRHMSSYSAEIYYYTAADRGLVLHGNPDLVTEKPLAGPVIYDTLPLYHWHWFIEAATEYDEEPDQGNVYDMLFKQIGVDPETVDPRFKRPFVTASAADKLRADDFFRLLYYERNEDWRKEPYWVVAPTSQSTLRSARYEMWLDLIAELAKTRKVMVVGQVGNGIMPETDMPFTEFIRHLGELASHEKNVVNVIGQTPTRFLIGLIASAEGVITLDSGLLYVAQGLRKPAVSIWGPHHPAVRIGYDKEYMDLAVYQSNACPHAPCYAYRKFPAHKCPRKSQQEICEPLAAVTPAMVMAKVGLVTDRRFTKVELPQAGQA